MKYLVQVELKKMPENLKKFGISKEIEFVETKKKTDLLPLYNSKKL
jgi:hypothetical protein